MLCRHSWTVGRTGQPAPIFNSNACATGIAIAITIAIAATVGLRGGGTYADEFGVAGTTQA